MVKFVGSIIGILLLVNHVIWGQQEQKSRNPFSSLLPLPSAKILTPQSEILTPNKRPSVLIPHIKPSQNLPQISQSPEKILDKQPQQKTSKKKTLKKIEKRKSEQISKKKISSKPKAPSKKRGIPKLQTEQLPENISKKAQGVAIRKVSKKPRFFARGKKKTVLILTGIVKTSKGRFAMIQIGEREYVVSERGMIMGKQLLEIQEGQIILEEGETQKILMIQK